MALRLLFVVLCALTLSGTPQALWAEEPPPAPPAPQQAPTPAEPTLTPPSLMGELDVPYPKGAPKKHEPVLVVATITINEEGAVSEVTLTTPPQPLFDEALVTALKGARFKPAQLTQEGSEPQAVAVQLTFEQRFEAPPPSARLSGWLREKGTRRAVPGATVVIAPEGGGAPVVVSADEEGRFEAEVGVGAHRVIVQTSVHKTFKQSERLEEDQALTVGYLLERLSYGEDELVIIGTRDRAEVSSTTLTGRELRQVPGTFGDPFRVVQALPGVTTPVSLLPLPVVRGSSPSSTGFLLDQTRLPLLFHLLGGPSVVHPEMIEEMKFFAGGAPVAYGGYTGGVIDGVTRPAYPGERVVDLDLNLTQAGALVRAPLPGPQLTFTGAGRVGYPGLLLSLLSDEVSLSYWDYQARLDQGTARTGWSLLSFGARDLIMTKPADGGPLAPSLRYEFHRVDLSGRWAEGPWSGRAQLAVGLDQTQLGEGGAPLEQRHVTPRLEGRWTPSNELSVRLGLNGAWRISEIGQAMEGADPGGPAQTADEQGLTTPPSDSLLAGAYAEVLWGLTERLYLTPGVRVDGWSDESAQTLTFDPRLNLRYLAWGEKKRPNSPQNGTKDPQSEPQERQEQEGGERSLWLKGSVGRYHQPPRFLVPIPGLDQLPLSYGMLASTQSALGLELRLGEGVSLDVQGYYSDMDPVIFDLSINASSLQDLPTALPGQLEEDTTAEDIAERLLSAQVGRAYGLELMLRKRSRSGVYGWLAYTRSRSERKREGAWVPFDFDRPHILNAVLGVPLGAGWEVGGRFQYQSGAPVTTTYGYNEGRKQAFMRLDLRIDKRVVWREWLLDYYIDIQNVTLAAEEVAPGQRLRFVLPTLGLRGRL